MELVIQSLSRENKWVKAYRTSRGEYVDSKLRTGETIAKPAEFISEWRTADLQMKRDMERAFQFFRGSADEINGVINSISRDDPTIAQRDAGFVVESKLKQIEEVPHCEALRELLRSTAQDGIYHRAVEAVLRYPWLIFPMQADAG